MNVPDVETLSGAVRNLARHKLRTSLTMLGMVFGVGAVIAMLSIGAGGEKKALEAIGKLGLRNVIVRAKNVKPEERQEAITKRMNERGKVNERMTALVKQRDAFIAEQQKKRQPAKAADSFDQAVQSTLRTQIKR